MNPRLELLCPTGREKDEGPQFGVRRFQGVKREAKQCGKSASTRQADARTAVLQACVSRPRQCGLAAVARLRVSRGRFRF